MQKERVSSRTIQFQESVEIIEIPREDSGTQLSLNKINKGPSSDSCSIGVICFSISIYLDYSIRFLLDKNIQIKNKYSYRNCYDLCRSWNCSPYSI
jgi:hypothetical protein